MPIWDLQVKNWITEFLKLIDTSAQTAKWVLDFPRKALTHAFEFLSLEDRLDGYGQKYHLMKSASEQVSTAILQKRAVPQAHETGNSNNRAYFSEGYMNRQLGRVDGYIYEVTHTLLHITSIQGLSKLYVDYHLHDKNNKFMAEEVTAEEVPVKEIRDRLNHVRKTGCVYNDSVTRTYGGMEMYLPGLLNMIPLGNSPFSTIVRRL